MILLPEIMNFYSIIDVSVHHNTQFTQNFYRICIFEDSLGIRKSAD